MFLQAAAETPPPGPNASAGHCPFHRADAGTCQATFSGLRVEWRRRRSHCTTDDHDDCALFLSRVLRRSRPKATLDPWPLHQK